MTDATYTEPRGRDRVWDRFWRFDLDKLGDRLLDVPLRAFEQACDAVSEVDQQALPQNPADIFRMLWEFFIDSDAEGDPYELLQETLGAVDFTDIDLCGTFLALACVWPDRDNTVEMLDGRFQDTN